MYVTFICIKFFLCVQHWRSDFLACSRTLKIPHSNTVFVLWFGGSHILYPPVHNLELSTGFMGRLSDVLVLRFGSLLNRMLLPVNNQLQCAVIFFTRQKQA